MDHTKNAVAIFNKLADLYQQKFMDVQLYVNGFDLFCEHIKKQGAEILDVACGPGNITRYLLDKRPDFIITGIDLSENMLSLARLNNPTAEFQLMDCRDIGLLQKKYDAIMCGFFLPYLSKEEAINFIGNAAKIMKQDGLLYISTMEDAYETSGFKKGSTGDEIFMYYHEAGYLLEALIKNHYTIVQLTRQDYPSPDGVKTTDLVIIAKLTI